MIVHKIGDFIRLLITKAVQKIHKMTKESAKSAASGKKTPFREVLPKKGLIFHESESQPVLCKPKLLPLKSFTLQKLEKMQKEATTKAQQQMEEEQKQIQDTIDGGGSVNFQKVWPLN